MFRKQKDQILKDIPDKIIFITGPRQVGKTWLSMDIAKTLKIQFTSISTDLKTDK